MSVRDTRTVSPRWYTRWVTPVLNDPRDVPFVGLMAQCLAFMTLSVSMFFAGPWLWYLAPVYWALLLFGLLDRFTLMLHCTSHRQLFNPRHRRLNHIIPWVIGPFFGQTPETYFAHHMGMHHSEENLEDDLSSTMRFQRDSFGHWLEYYCRFLFVGLVDLSRYMWRRRRHRLFRRIVIGEGVFWSVTAALAFFRPGPVFVVLVFPVLLIRTLMMAGNWAQHAFIAEDRPESPYASSITCINARYNRRCFNDGYHIGHHLQARAHWTEYPVEFEANLTEYARNDAIVFEGVDFFIVWLLLMTGRWKRLARAYVQLPGAPARTEEEVIRHLKSRVRPLAVGVSVATAEAA